METIKEDYVSFETAKLLKEKGFNGQYHMYYVEDGKYICSDLHDIKDYAKSIVQFDYLHRTKVPAPTLQMARKWLRLKHGIYIDVHLSFTKDPEAYPAVYYVYILDAKSGNSLLEKAAHIGELNPLMDINNHDVPINFDSPEEAANVAIKYCLENLI